MALLEIKDLCVSVEDTEILKHINMSIGPEEMLKQPYGVWMEEFKAKEQAEADSAEEE